MDIIQCIQNRIYVIRGIRVMLDQDLADLYESDTRTLNQAVKRNIDRFPDDFMFQLTKQEWEDLQILRSQIVILRLGHGQHAKYLPFVFTEQGVAMLSSVLRSSRAVQMNIAIMRAFVQIRKTLMQTSDMRQQLLEIKERLGEHDIQLNSIYDALENLLDEKAAQTKWEHRERIGFRKHSK